MLLLSVAALFVHVFVWILQLLRSGPKDAPAANMASSLLLCWRCKQSASHMSFLTNQRRQQHASCSHRCARPPLPTADPLPDDLLRQLQDFHMLRRDARWTNHKARADAKTRSQLMPSVQMVQEADWVARQPGWSAAWRGVNDRLQHLLAHELPFWVSYHVSE